MAGVEDSKQKLFCADRPRPYRPHHVHWSMGIVHAINDPSQVYEKDDLTVTLYDGFPKASYHYLVLPKEEPIDSISELLPRHLPLLKRMDENAEKLIKKIKSVDPDTIFRKGYHAVPSLKRLHLHVVSQDFNSSRMKRKHHWNTFNTEYFVDSDVVMETLEKRGQINVVEKEYNDLLELPMRCNFCELTFEDIGDLKRHIRSHDKEKDRKLR